MDALGGQGSKGRDGAIRRLQIETCDGLCRDSDTQCDGRNRDDIIPFLSAFLFH